MQKEETKSSNQEEIKKNEKKEKHGSIREIARLIADSSYECRYTLERYTESQYRFGFGIVESGNIPGMFVGKTANEAMYRAIDFELTSVLKLTSRDELTKLAEDRLATIQDDQKKHKELEEEFSAKNIEYKELTKERDGLKQERGAISNIINRVTDRWKDDVVMQSFEKEIASWKKRPSVFIAFLLEHIEKLMHETTPYIAPPIEAPEKMEEEHPLKEKALALVNRMRIFESIWNDLRDNVLDGEWHDFSEADEIIRTHGYRELTIESMQRKRGAYIRFAKDEKYHTARGGIDYLYKRKPVKGVYKFRFTPVVKEVKPEKIVEKGLELGRTVDRISGHPIHENTRDEFLMLFCDGKWHSSSDVNEMLKKYDKYNRCKQSAFPALRSAYMRHVGKSYNKITKHEGGTYTFKFDKKRVGADAVKSPNNVKCARCGQVIHYGEKTHQVDKLFYHPDCYEVMEL